MEFITDKETQDHQVQQKRKDENQLITGINKLLYIKINLLLCYLRFKIAHRRGRLTGQRAKHDTRAQSVPMSAEHAHEHEARDKKI